MRNIFIEYLTHSFRHINKNVSVDSSLHLKSFNNHLITNSNNFIHKSAYISATHSVSWSFGQFVIQSQISVKIKTKMRFSSELVLIATVVIFAFAINGNLADCPNGKIDRTRWLLVNDVDKSGNVFCFNLVIIQINYSTFSFIPEYRDSRCDILKSFDFLVLVGYCLCCDEE